MDKVTIWNLISIAVGLAGIIGGSLFARAGLREREIAADMRADDSAVDPWELQADLMRRSGQRIPALPRLHNGVLLYAALNAEELAETHMALALAIPHYCDVTIPKNIALSLQFREVAAKLAIASRDIRTILTDHDVGDHMMNEKDACDIFDGTTDLAVTNCGFALSCGFPGGTGYAAVVNSNISKANPQTGKIDKTPDGKWIKGPNYREPNLRAVLRHWAPVWAMRSVGEDFRNAEPFPGILAASPPLKIVPKARPGAQA